MRRRHWIALFTLSTLLCTACVHTRTRCGSSTVGLPGLVQFAPKGK